MRSATRSFLILSSVLLLAGSLAAQADDICSEVGFTPSFDSPFAHVPYVYGRIALQGFDQGSKLPKVSIILLDIQQGANRWTVSKSGNYCFKRKSSAGTLIVEVNGVEVERRPISSSGPSQQREDFVIYAAQSQRSAPPEAISAKFTHPRNEKTIDLYKKAADAEKNKDLRQAVEHLKQIVFLDPEDFIAWAKLGSLHFEKNSLSDAVLAFRKSLELKVEYIPAWINVGKIRFAQKQYEAAIEIFKHAASLDPTSARTFQLLGEAYLQARQGTLGSQALNEAIRLDPSGMAECHLQLAHLYQLAGAKDLATREYKLFLKKVPEHPERKKFEKFVKDNPEKAGQD